MEGDDREMLALGVVADRHLDGGAGLATDEGVRRSAGRPAWPSLARLESWAPTRRTPYEVDLVEIPTA